MAKPVVTFIAGQEVWDFTELANTTGSSALHRAVHTATFFDDNSALNGDYFVDINYAYIPNPPVVPGSLLVSLSATYNSLNPPWRGTVDFDFSVMDKQIDFLRENQTLSQQIRVRVWDDFENLFVEKLITINVHGKNDKPKANIDIASTSENTSAYTYKVTGNDTDPDRGDHLRVISTGVASVTSVGASYLTPAMVALTKVTFINNTSTSPKDSLKVVLDKAFQGLATGENALIVIKYTIADDLNATSASEFRLTITGADDTQIIGTNNADKNLWGEKNADDIFGLNGDDIIHPRAGHDNITGGAGKDTYVFAVIQDSAATNPDDILDFKHLEDKIDLSAFAGTFEFRGTAAFNGGHDIRYVVKSGYLQVEVDTTGDKVADMKIDVHGVTSLVLGDFVV
ncbi:MAG: M10 family metallopeptidase C-terminal domain-containing protein [Micropepsaceae bacterium]